MMSNVRFLLALVVLTLVFTAATVAMTLYFVRGL
jgi:hypothetical protein